MQVQNAAPKHKKKKTMMPPVAHGATSHGVGVQGFGHAPIQQQGFASQGSMVLMQGQHHMYQFPYIPSGYEKQGHYTSQFQ
jgi:hypothetical protein